MTVLIIALALKISAVLMFLQDCQKIETAPYVRHIGRLRNDIVPNLNIQSVLSANCWRFKSVAERYE